MSFDYENSEERQQSVFDIDPSAASLEYLAEVTDEFASSLVYQLLGEETYRKAYEDNEVRIIAVKMCSKFLELMQARAKRQQSYTTIVNGLNGLL